MNKPRLIETGLPFSTKANLDELAYRNKIQLSEKKYATIDKWKKFTQFGVLNIIPFLLKQGVFFKGKILEIGAGACWLSSELSKIDKVQEVYALDFSDVILRQIAPHIMHYLGANTSKITCVVGDFNDLRFEDRTFDFVVCDATLHHSSNLPWLLNQIRKVLKDDGTVVAFREPILSPLKLLAKFQEKRFGVEEKKYGVTENIYNLNEWREYFDRAGFEACFFPYIHHTNLKGRIVRFSPLRFLNGYLFSKFIFIASKHSE